ncbi:MAG TPA: hypothetical protein VII49_10580 [Rhizomicrobium sp.]
MRRLSIAGWSIAAVLLIGPIGAHAHGDDDAGIRLGWSVSDISGTSNEPAHAGDDETFAPDLPMRFPGYDLQFSPSIDDTLLAAGPADLSSTLFESRSFLDSSLALASDLHLELRAADVRPNGQNLPILSDLAQLQLSRAAEFGGSRTLLAGADWDIASWGGLGIAGARIESASGFDVPMNLELPGTRVTTMLGVSAHLNFGDGWVTSFSYDEARTNLDLQPSAVAVTNDERDRSGFDAAVSKDNLFGEDALGVALVRPVQTAGAGLATAGNFSGLLGPQISLSSATPETDLQLDYETSFNGNITLQANAGYQMNASGQNGTKAISVLSRAKINF